MDRVSYLLQEIYGIENKNKQDKKVSSLSYCTCALVMHKTLNRNRIFFVFCRRNLEEIPHGFPLYGYNKISKTIQRPIVTATRQSNNILLL